MLIQKFSDDWHVHFLAIQRELEKVVGSFAIGIEHVGSTAVRNLDAKAVIDIDIVYEGESDFQKIKNGLEKIGYCHHGNQGIAGREVFKRTGINYHDILDKVKHHLYACRKDSMALEQHILFRNYLRANNDAREKYQQMKYALAEQAGQDRKRYAALKEKHLSNFIAACITEASLSRNRVSGI